MSRIVIDARIINSSTGTYVERLLHYLQKIDHKNQYLILIPSKDKNYWAPTNKNFSIVAADFPNYSIAEQTSFNRFLNKLKPGLVHFCMPQQPISYKGLHVTTIHDLTLLKTYNSDKNWATYKFKQQVGKKVFKKIGRTSAHIIVPSNFTKQEYIKFSGINKNKISVIYEAADAVDGELVPYQHPFKHFLLYVGQQSDYKNIKALGDAHQKLLVKYPDLGLILVGRVDANIRKNQKYFEKKKYRNIVFTGFISNSQRDWLYKNATAYVFPSKMEGFGLPGLEAMGYGTPVISSNTTCLPEIYDDGAIYFNPNNVNNMALVIFKVLSDKNLRDKLIQNGYKQFKKYSWRKTAEETYQIYLNALKK